MAVNQNEGDRSSKPWIVAGAIAVLAIVMVLVFTDRDRVVQVWIYIVDRKWKDSPAGPDPAAVELQAQQRIAELQESFKAYSEGELDFRNLLPDVARYVEDYPDRMEGHILLAQVNMKLERWEPALKHLDRALSIDPDSYQLQKLAGTCAAKLQRWPQAEAHLRSAMSMQADRDIHLMLGNVYFQTQRYEPAEQQFNLAMQKSGQTPPHKALSGLAALRSKQGQHREALTLVDDAIFFSKADGTVSPWTYPLQKVFILMEAGEMDVAGAMLIAVINDQPEASYTLEYAKLQARLWAHQDRAAAIPGMYEDLVSRLIADPERDPAVLGEALADLAHWRLEMNQRDRAAASLSTLRSIRPDHPRLGELEARLGSGQ